MAPKKKAQGRPPRVVSKAKKPAGRPAKKASKKPAKAAGKPGKPAKKAGRKPATAAKKPATAAKKPAKAAKKASKKPAKVTKPATSVAKPAKVSKPVKPAKPVQAAKVAKSVAPAKIAKVARSIDPLLGRRVKKTLPQPPKPKTAEERRAEAAQKAEAQARAREEKQLQRVQREAERVAEREQARAARAQSAEEARVERERLAEEVRAARAKSQEEARMERARVADEERERARAAAERKRHLALIAAAIAQAEREANKREAAQAAAEAKQRHAARKVAEREQKLQAQAAAALGRTEEKQRLRELERALAGFDKAEVARSGATTAELVGTLVTVLGARAALSISRSELGPAWEPSELSGVAAVAPLAALSFFRGLGPVEFRWQLAGEETALGGQLSIADIATITHWLGELGPSDTAWSDQLCERARVLFAPVNQQDAIRLRLERSAVPRFTPQAELLACLEARGGSARGSKALLDWLGQDIALTLDAAATPEGRRRLELTERARLASLEDARMQLGVLLALNRGPVLDKEQLSRAVAEHRAFLEAGGGGGRFELGLDQGLPRLRYQHSAAASGQARLSFENLTGLKCVGLRLAFAEFCGVRAEGTSFARAELEGSCFAFAQLSRANFSEARLRGVDFRSAHLAGADFRKADLTEVNFEQADLRGAHFAGAITSATRFGSANVQGIKY